MKTILVPTDFSHNAHVALQYAARIVAQINGKLILFHNATLQVSAAEVPVWQEPDPELVQLFEYRLKKEAEQINSEQEFNLEIETICRPGLLNQNINNLVREKKVDLVIMGTKGANSWVTKFTGTMTAAYMKEAICPVLIVPPGAAYAVPQQLAYAADFQNEEGVFLSQLLQITAPLKAALTIVNVKSNQQLHTITDDQILDEINQQFPDNDFCFAGIRENNIAASLEAFVTENQMDVLALALRKRSFLGDLFHKSLTRELAFHATIPLLILPETPYQPVKKTLVQREFRIG